MQNVWIESYDPTIEDSYTKLIEVDVSLCIGTILLLYKLANRFCTGTAMHAGNVQLPGLLKNIQNADFGPFSLDTAGTEQFSKQLQTFPPHLLSFSKETRVKISNLFSLSHTQLQCETCT